MSLPLLICDDSSFARKQMARALPDGWDVDISFAANGAEGIDAIRAGKGDVLLLDLNMPVMDGYEVLEAIRKQDLPTVVIVVSGDIQPEARERVLQLGAIDFIKKPTDRAGITRVLQQYGLITEKKSEIKTTEIDVDLYDCYQEIANVAMGQAADLLARLLNVFVVLPAPRVNIFEASELHMALQLAGSKDTFSAVCQGYIGDGIAGEALLIFSDSSFPDIAKLMKYEGMIDDAVEIELLMDVSSILIGACLKGIADQLDMTFSQGHPVVLGQHFKVSDLIKTSPHSRNTLAIEINYKIENHNIDCDLLLLFTEDTIPIMNNKVSCLID
ncbi:MAG: response regulator [Gammaproteobacteria bacterium]